MSRPHPLFFASRQAFPVGTVLVGRPPRHDDAVSNAVEVAFERHRPEGHLSRLESVYMLDTSDEDTFERAGAASVDHVYEVRPLGPVEKNDVAWWGELYDEVFQDYRASGQPLKRRRSREEWLRDIALNYFSGLTTVRPLWEHRAKAVEIVRELTPDEMAEPRLHNPAKPKFDDDPVMLELGLGRIAQRAAHALGVETGRKPYGCGQFGCAFPTTDGRVLKVTVDREEVRWAWAAHQLAGTPEGRGFARVDVPPLHLWPLRYEGHAYAYVREDVPPLRARDLSKRVRNLLENLQALSLACGSHDFQVDEERNEECQTEYVRQAEELERDLPEIMRAALTLARGPEARLTYDMGASNMGRRADGTVVLFDGRIKAGWEETNAHRIARDMHMLEEQLVGDETRASYLPKFRDFVSDVGGFENALRRRLRPNVDEATWKHLVRVAHQLKEDPDLYMRQRLGNPLMLAGVAALFAMMPITPVAAGVTAYRRAHR